MNRPAFLLPALTVVALTAGAALAFAEEPTTPPASTAASSEKPATSAETPAVAPAAAKPATPSSSVANVENWSRREWHKARREWMKDKTKWADCRHQAKAKNLSGRNSWSFLYDCMNK